MELGLSLKLLALAIGTFKDERKDRFLKRQVKIEQEFNDEMDKGKDKRSDLTLGRLLREHNTLAKLVIAESIKNK